MSEIPVNIPKVSVAIDEATPTEWIVADGQPVTEGQPLYVIATDKVETEVPAPASGIVHWDGELEQAYQVGTRIGWIKSQD
jgi:pyruvate/2-oxoglutarate dehydrogenase complex dihydrolipoamide acyltransferase (E2) component